MKRQTELMRVIHYLLGFLGACILTSLPLAANPLQCADLTPLNDETGYKARSGRCEGLYVADTRSSLRLKGVLTLTSRSNPISGMLSASISPNPPTANYHLSIHSLDPREHYQLDTIMPNTGIFSWPRAEVIDKAGIDPAKLTPLSRSITNPVHYIPVSYSGHPGNNQNNNSDILIIIESTVPIQQYVARLSAEIGGEQIELKEQSPIPTTQLTLALQSPGLAGYYKFWLTVRLLGESEPDGGSWKLWIP